MTFQCGQAPQIVSQIDISGGDMLDSLNRRDYLVRLDFTNVMNGIRLGASLSFIENEEVGLWNFVSV